MRAIFLVLVCGALFGAIWWFSRADSVPGTVVAVTDQSRDGPVLTSHALRKLLPGPIRPDEPQFLVVSTGPAELSDGVPPT